MEIEQIYNLAIPLAIIAFVVFKKVKKKQEEKAEDSNIFVENGKDLFEETIINKGIDKVIESADKIRDAHAQVRIDPSEENKDKAKEKINTETAKIASVGIRPPHNEIEAVELKGNMRSYRARGVKKKKARKKSKK